MSTHSSYSGLWCMVAVLSATGLACGEDVSEPRPRVGTTAADTSFTPPRAEEHRRVDTVVAADLDGMGMREYIVASGPDSAAGTIDRVEVYRYASAQAGFVIAFRDTLEFGADLELREITGDERPEILIPLRQRGNDPVTSFGLHVYSADSNGIRRVFRSPWMNPQLDTLAGWKGRAIFTHRELWPLFASHADAETFVDDVFVYEEGRYRSVAREIPRFFRDRSRAQLERLRSVTDTLTTDSVGYAVQLTLFRSVALVMINLTKSGDRAQAQRFWLNNKELLRRVLEGPQFDEIEELAGHLTAP